MNNTPLTFVHGWGCSPNIWDSLIADLSDFQCKTIDLGFTRDQTDLKNTDSEESIYITHSLGTMWALKNRYKNMRVLIAINGFACFESFTQPNMLKRMQINLKKDPAKQMHDFWEMSDLPPQNTLNVDQLKNGLNWLSKWDYTHDLNNIPCKVKSIYGDNDPILDINAMHKHWHKHSHTVIRGAGHAIPLSHHKECAEIIRKWINDL